jgi:hypothetical protein
MNLDFTGDEIFSRIKPAELASKWGIEHRPTSCPSAELANRIATRLTPSPLPPILFLIFAVEMCWNIGEITARFRHFVAFISQFSNEF